MSELLSELWYRQIVNNADGQESPEAHAIRHIKAQATEIERLTAKLAEAEKRAEDATASTVQLDNRIEIADAIIGRWYAWWTADEPKPNPPPLCESSAWLAVASPALLDVPLFLRASRRTPMP